MKRYQILLIALLAILTISSCSMENNPPQKDGDKKTEDNSINVSPENAGIFEVKIPFQSLNMMTMRVYMDPDQRPQPTISSEWIDPEEEHIYCCNLEVNNGLPNQTFYDNALEDIPVSCYLIEGGFVEDVKNAEFKTIKRTTADNTEHTYLCISFNGKDYTTSFSPMVDHMDTHIVEGKEAITFKNGKIDTFEYKKKDSHGTSTYPLQYIKDGNINNEYHKYFMFTYIYPDGTESEGSIYNNKPDQEKAKPVKLRVEARKGGDFYPYTKTFDITGSFK